MKSQPPGATPQSAALTGIGLMLVGIFFFALNDALGKWLIATYSVGELLLIRSIAALTLILPFIGRDIRAFTRAPLPSIQMLRAAFATLEVASATGRWPICRSPT